MKKILLFTIMILGFSVNSIRSQSFITPDDYLVNGYAYKLSGFDFEYQSCIPGLRECFLIRATNENDFMEWETDPVPTQIKKKYSAFVWIAALGSSPGKAGMNLAVNGVQTFSFSTDSKPEWQIDGPDNSSLSFHSILTDQNGDQHGYMVLRIATDKVPKGKALKIRVTGSNANLSSWYMTFKKQVKTGVTLNSFPALMKTASGPAQLVEAGIFLNSRSSSLRDTSMRPYSRCSARPTLPSSMTPISCMP